MARAIAYRGPDGADVWVDADARIAMAHRRLAIVDLTAAGAQPMVSADGRWVISYNGEVYNAEAIAALPQMAGLVRRGTSDTEVIVESVARRGLDATLADLNGMFAIALWDRSTRTLHLIRDRLGIKPLFYGLRHNDLWFASELKSFAAIGLSLEIDAASVASFLRYSYVPAPQSIYRDFRKIMPGEIVSFGSSGEQRRRYWRLQDAACNGARSPFSGSDADAEEQLHSLLADAVSSNMISDVPLGAFLSGGIDSSLVTALMMKAGRGPVRTFSIGFPDFGYDESAHARAVAVHLGTAHEQMIVTAKDALAVVPSLPDMYDEPFADSSQIPTHLISRMTRAHVTVALSGDGGDELFAGYNRHAIAAGRFSALRSLPLAVRRRLSGWLEALPEAGVDALTRCLPPRLRVSQPKLKLQKLAEILALEDGDLWLQLVSQNDPNGLTDFLEHALELPDLTCLGNDALARMQVCDTAFYLPDDILQKVDRAAMCVSLEVRPPLLDHRVVEFAFSLPRHLRWRDGQTKWMLRRLLERYVPRTLFERSKMGFAVPLQDWLKGPLREWAEDLLGSQQFGGGFLDAKAVQVLWREHLEGRANRAYQLWTILMFEAWRLRWHGGPALAPKASLA